MMGFALAEFQLFSTSPTMRRMVDAAHSLLVFQNVLHLIDSSQHVA
jgi:hypothetical protein